MRKAYRQEDIDSIVPEWFQHLMTISKIELVSQFQKLDFLEKRRLNHSLSFKKKENSFVIDEAKSNLENRPPRLLLLSCLQNSLTWAKYKKGRTLNQFSLNTVNINPC